MTVFGDSSFLVALFYKDDKYHKTAVEIGKELEEKEAVLIISNICLAEAVNVVFRVSGPKQAKKFYNLIMKSKIKLFSINQEIYQKGLRVLFKQKSKQGVNFFDCLHLAAMKYLKIKTILSFDRDFEKAGVRVMGINY
ncbi:PIN domain-containing protein [Microgenomates group bacterium]|nr:PIN domain-containing protein [Microgenomates group bacterium]